MVQTHILQTCWWEVNGNEFEASEKSDMGKRWMKPRRDKSILLRPEYHLIVTEGTATEPQYFEVIRDIINRQYKDKIQIDIYGEGDNTLSLLDKAINRVKNNPNGYKHVWIVYDTDDFPSAHINKTNEACVNLSTEETQYHAIWSNQCIELWFLLHFGFFSQIFIETNIGLNSLNG